MKNQLAAFLFLIACSAAVSRAQELPLFGRLPQPGRDWTLREQGADKDPGWRHEYAWATFTNVKTGDILSFVADSYDNVVRKVGDAPVRQASSDMFPGGYPIRFMTTPTQPTKPNGWMIGDVIRSNVVTLDTGVQGGRKNVRAEALEYSYVYEDEANNLSNRLAHGYVVAFGTTVVFVQHTSTHAITSLDVHAIVLSLIRDRQ